MQTTNAAFIPQTGWQALGMRTAFVSTGERKMNSATQKRNDTGRQPSLAALARQQAERNRQMQATIDRLMPSGLTVFVDDAFSGDNTLVNVGAAVSADDAARSIVAAIEPHFETRLSEKQRSDIALAVAFAWNRRISERKAGLVDIQSRLASPAGRMFA